MGHLRILFILKERDNYFACDDSNCRHKSSGLYNSSKFIHTMLARLGFTTKIVEVVDANGIHREIVLFRADIVIIEAFWVLPSKFDELRRVCPRVKFVVRNHSKMAFMSGEGSSMDKSLEYVKRHNVRMSCNDLATVNDIRFLTQKQFPNWPPSKVDEKVVYLPNYYPVELTCPVKRHHSEVLNVGCFGAIRPLKNQLIQAVAALKYTTRVHKKLHFHINATRIEQSGQSILKNLIQLFEHYPEEKLIKHDWCNHEEFLELVREMDLIMQVSLSETFNIISADAVVSGVPIVVSDQVPWVSRKFQAKSDDSEDIAAKIHVAMTDIESERWNLFGLEHYNRDTVSQWMRSLLHESSN